MQFSPPRKPSAPAFHGVASPVLWEGRIPNGQGRHHAEPRRWTRDPRQGLAGVAVCASESRQSVKDTLVRGGPCCKTRCCSQVSRYEPYIAPRSMGACFPEESWNYIQSNMLLVA